LVRLMETKIVKRIPESSSTVSKPVFKKLLVALDGSESSQRAAQAALELAEKLKTDLIVLQAITPPKSYYHSTIAYYAYARKAAMGIVGETESKAKKQGIHVKTEIPEAVSSVV